MTKIALDFEVNDASGRKEFVINQLLDILSGLKEHSKPIWGKMSPQQMVEHLIWTFDVSTGLIQVSCYTPENKIEAYKRFLRNNLATKQNFKNPILGDTLPQLSFKNLKDAVEALQKKIAFFYDFNRSNSKGLHTHPIFGPLDFEEWERGHYKRCFHHLQQFDLLEAK
ncbi:MAG: hypothetical protein AAGA43_13930 [Bacteroidota bacterium]